MSTIEESIAELAAVKGSYAGTLVLELCGEEPSGSFGTQILADLGATVLKIERPPNPNEELPVFTPPADDGLLPSELAFFCGLSRNKRSLCLDLKKDEGRRVFHKLAKIADVFYDNYKPGVTARLGADYETLKKINPDIICCSVSGFGHTGPWAELPGYDATILAQGGGMSITGTGNPPVRWGNPIGGIGGALYGVVGILAALRRRRKTNKGGAWVDISMLDTQLAMHAYRVAPALDGKPYLPEPMRGGIGSVPYGTFKAGDGRWVVFGITNQFWPKACAALGHPEWIKDPRFIDQKQRQINENLVNAMVSEALQARSADEWQVAFVEAGIPGGKVNTIPEAFEHPHVALRDTLVGFKNSKVGKRVKVAGNPIKMSQHKYEGFESPPGFGEDSELVLKKLLHFSMADCESLREQGATWWPRTGRVYSGPASYKKDLSMRQIEIKEWTTPEHLTVSEGPPPVCGEREVLIRVQTCAITYSLWLLIQGKYQRKPAFPFIPGSFIAGYISECGGGVRHFKKGDRVMATIEEGGLAEEVVAHEANTFAIPDALPFSKANALTNSYNSVMAALTWRRALDLQKGETLLVNGAAGNVGTAAVEIGRTLGATVIASASTAEKRAAVLERGAHHAIESDPKTLRDRVMELTAKKGVDAVFDPVGGELFHQSMRCLRPNGRITPFGFAGGDVPQIPANLILVKNISVAGINMGQYRMKERDRYEDLIRKMFTQLGEWFVGGHINPVTSAIFPLERTPEAFQAVMSRDKIGHVVVALDEEASRLGSTGDGGVRVLEQA